MLYTTEKQLCTKQFSAHEALDMLVNVEQINMTKTINKEAFYLHKIYDFSNGLRILWKVSLKVKLSYS